MAEVEQGKVFTMLGGANPGVHFDIPLLTKLENNPEVMNTLAYRLGLLEKLAFYDVYSLDDPGLMAMVPRPVFALLTTIPMTSAWKRERDAEDAPVQWYKGAGSDEPVMWFRQTIIHGCGLIGLLHCVSNGTPSDMIVPGSELANLLREATPLHMDERAQLLKDNESVYEASQAVAVTGDSTPLELSASEGTGNHFVAFAKTRNGHLWELEGSRKGPLDRGSLKEDEDAFSEAALELGIKRLIRMQQEEGSNVRFSCIALAQRP